ncbi:MAG: hypothetical protein DWQ42_13910 [Planctomycetota bacterium]|nr:MAG: hypothetical protein DWQ42_13910 [Planctomycetota bacterium]REK39506.1 MAG: hypothetical protein DWQ46_19065 [Planctomycetota bacterium]
MQAEERSHVSDLQRDPRGDRGIGLRQAGRCRRIGRPGRRRGSDGRGRGRNVPTRVGHAAALTDNPVGATVPLAPLARDGRSQPIGAIFLGATFSGAIFSGVNFSGATRVLRPCRSTDRLASAAIAGDC